jgi:hypothetical protein
VAEPSSVILPLEPATVLSAETLEDCTHIVGMMGHEPTVEALRSGADVVLAGRATDTATVAAVPLMLGMPSGPTWHAAKLVECGGQCTTNPRSTPIKLEGAVIAGYKTVSFVGIRGSLIVANIDRWAELLRTCWPGGSSLPVHH